MKAWKIQEKRDELKRMENGDFGEGEDVDALLAQQMMVSMIPGCGFKSSTDSIASSASQTTQVYVVTTPVFLPVPFQTFEELMLLLYVCEARNTCKF